MVLSFVRQAITYFVFTTTNIVLLTFYLFYFVVFIGRKKSTAELPCTALRYVFLKKKKIGYVDFTIVL